jgi:hypothetical protein
MARVEYRLSAPTPPLCFLRKWEGGVLQKRLSSNDQGRSCCKRSSKEFPATGRTRRGERVGYVARFETGISKRRYFANHADFEIWLYSRPAAVEFVPWRIWKPALRKEFVRLENEAHFSPSVFASNSRDSRASENSV